MAHLATERANNLMLKKLYINGDSHTAGTYNSNTHFGFCRHGSGDGNEFIDGFSIHVNPLLLDTGISVPVARHHYDKNIGAR